MSKGSHSLGAGWYDPGEREDWMAKKARWQFLLAIADRLAAREKVLVRLREHVLPIYAKTPLLETPTNGPLQLKPYPELEKALLAWGRDCRLCDGTKGMWVLGHALNTIWSWHKLGRPLQTLQFLPVPTVINERLELPEFQFRSWWIHGESRGRYRKGLLDVLDKYLDDAEKKARAAGLKRLSPATTKYQEHFEWLVRRQVEGESFEDIAGADRSSQAETVKRAVTRLRKLIDLPTSPSGRPPKA